MKKALRLKLTRYYFRKCEALGKLQRVIDKLNIQPIPLKETIEAKRILQICIERITNEIVFVAATKTFPKGES